MGHTYLIEDMYGGSSVDVRRRIYEHWHPESDIYWYLKDKESINVKIIFSGSIFQSQVVEALVLELSEELGLKLVNKRKESSKLNISDQYVQLNEDIEIAIKEFPLKQDQEGHDELIDGLRYFINESIPITYNKK